MKYLPIRLYYSQGELHEYTYQAATTVHQCWQVLTRFPRGSSACITYALVNKFVQAWMDFRYGGDWTGKRSHYVPTTPLSLNMDASLKKYHLSNIWELWYPLTYPGQNTFSVHVARQKRSLAFCTGDTTIMRIAEPYSSCMFPWSGPMLNTLHQCGTHTWHRT